MKRSHLSTDRLSMVEAGLAGYDGASVLPQMLVGQKSEFYFLCKNGDIE